MKETLLQFARYNTWANSRLVETMLKVDEEDLDKEIISSFPSLKKTVYHVWSAEFIWFQRLELTEQPVWIQGVFEGSFAEACTDWLKVSAALEHFIDRQFDDRAFEHVFQYYDREKNSHKNPVYMVLMHIFNHSTYHRGQLVTMLRQLGVTKIPGTDFIAFTRK